jgi:GNAT superfamily N-acetyltransferase
MTDTPGQPFTIRSATREDEPQLIVIQHSSAVHHAEIDPERWQATSLEASAAARRFWHGQMPRDEGIVAVAPDGTLIGMIELWLKRPRDLQGARIPRVKVDLGLAVAPEWRGRGVGTALLADLARLAQSRGCERIEWTAAAANRRGLDFYRRHGAVVRETTRLCRLEAEAIDRLVRATEGESPT